MEITSAFLTKLGSEYTNSKTAACDIESSNAVQLFSFSNESIEEKEEGITKKIKGIDGKKYDAFEKTYTEIVNGVEWNVVELTYFDNNGNRIKITTQTRNIVKNYNGIDVEFTLTKKEQEVCDASSTYIEKIIIEEERTKYHVITTITTEKKEKVGSKTYTNSKKTEKKEYLIKECKMPKGFVRDVLQF